MDSIITNLNHGRLYIILDKCISEVFTKIIECGEKRAVKLYLEICKDSKDRSVKRSLSGGDLTELYEKVQYYIKSDSIPNDKWKEAPKESIQYLLFCLKELRNYIVHIAKEIISTDDLINKAQDVKNHISDTFTATIKYFPEIDQQDIENWKIDIIEELNHIRDKSLLNLDIYKQEVKASQQCSSKKFITDAIEDAYLTLSDIRNHDAHFFNNIRALKSVLNHFYTIPNNDTVECSNILSHRNEYNMTHNIIVVRSRSEILKRFFMNYLLYDWQQFQNKLQSDQYGIYKPFFDGISLFDIVLIDRNNECIKRKLNDFLRETMPKVFESVKDEELFFRKNKILKSNVLISLIYSDVKYNLILDLIQYSENAKLLIICDPDHYNELSILLKASNKKIQTLNLDF